MPFNCQTLSQSSESTFKQMSDLQSCGKFVLKKGDLYDTVLVYLRHLIESESF